ncbi:cupin domain-containing protein [Flavitalea flava]
MKHLKHPHNRFNGIFTIMKSEFNANAWPCHVPDRLMDDQLLVFDFGELVNKLKIEDAWKNGDRNALTLLKSSELRIVLIVLKTKSELNFHPSGNLLSVQILTGSAKLFTAKKTVMLKTIGLLTLHDEAQHSLIALEESVILLTMAPANHKE